jgi:hypothetical protein
MKSFCTTIIFLSLCINFVAQEDQSYFHKQLFTEYDYKYHYLQATYFISNSYNQYGLQYKRQKVVTAGGVMTFSTGSSLGFNYSRQNNLDLLNSNIEVHLSSYPYTALIRLGAGVDYSTDFKSTSYLSFFPSLGFDIGIVEISYDYLINRYSSSEFSDHRIKVALGPWIKKT